MKKTIALSLLLSATSVILSATPSLAQIVPITGGTYRLNGTRNAGGGYDVTITPSNVLSPLGVVSLTAITNYSYSGTNFGGAFSISATTSNNFTFANFPTFGTNLALTGDASGSVGGNAFTAKPLAINATIDGSGQSSDGGGIIITSFNYNHSITGGSLTLSVPVPPAPVIPPAPTPVIPPAPAPITCTGCLIVKPDLLVSNGILQGTPVNDNQYLYPKEDFRQTSFSSRVLYLEDK